MTNNLLDKSANKGLITDKAKSFVDSEGHSRDLVRCARSPLISPYGMHAAAFINIAAFSDDFRRKIYAADVNHVTAFTLLHSR